MRTHYFKSILEYLFQSTVGISSNVEKFSLVNNMWNVSSKWYSCLSLVAFWMFSLIFIQGVKSKITTT